ncbi:uncharacterized protein LOC143182866 [Calliopsis andreniformis]|uniref:uncharacterized protein LOC143182866 n=1 Tax=Calliopsis andreniformis TaxID=337506 RepID=UPI003FCE1EA4
MSSAARSIFTLARRLSAILRESERAVVEVVVGRVEARAGLRRAKYQGDQEGERDDRLDVCAPLLAHTTPASFGARSCVPRGELWEPGGESEGRQRERREISPSSRASTTIMESEFGLCLCDCSFGMLERDIRVLLYGAE